MSSEGVPNHGKGTAVVLGCAFERDRKKGVLRMSQRAFIEFVVSQYGVYAVSNLQASQ